MDHGHSHGILIPGTDEERHTKEMDILEDIQTFLYTLSPRPSRKL